MEGLLCLAWPGLGLAGPDWADEQTVSTLALCSCPACPRVRGSPERANAQKTLGYIPRHVL